MKISRGAILLTTIFTLLLAGLVKMLTTIGYEKASAISVALVQSNALWQEYTLLKYEIFCQGNNGSLLVQAADPNKLFRFKEVAQRSKEAELILPFSESQKLDDINTHLKVFDEEMVYKLTSLNSDHKLFHDEQECTPIIQVPRLSVDEIAETTRTKSPVTARG